MNAGQHPEPQDTLYREVVLDHYRDPHGKAAIEDADISAEGLNPLCGDELDLALRLDDEGRIAALQLDGRGCAISVAAGSILHDLIEGVSLPEARRIVAAVRETMHGAGLPAEPDLGDFDALEGVKDFPVRIKCALLPWTTLEEALADAEKIVAARQAGTTDPHETNGGDDR